MILKRTLFFLFFERLKKVHEKIKQFNLGNYTKDYQKTKI